jgi:hypothetical protein
MNSTAGTESQDRSNALPATPDSGKGRNARPFLRVQIGTWLLIEIGLPAAILLGLLALPVIADRANMPSLLGGSMATELFSQARRAWKRR